MLEKFQFILLQHSIKYKIVFLGAARNAGVTGIAVDQFAAHLSEQYQIKVKRKDYVLAEKLFRECVMKMN